MWDWISNFLGGGGGGNNSGGGGGGWGGGGTTPGGQSSSWFSDPMFWLAAAGTGLGGYGAYSNQRANSRMIGDYNRAQRQANAGNLAYQNMYNTALQNYMGQQSGLMGQFSSMMGAPLDWKQYYEPLTAKAEEAIRRGVKGNAAERGLHDSAYADAMVGEAISKSESDRVAAAMGLANNQRQGMGGLLASALGSFRFNPPAPPGQLYSPMTPGQANMPSLGSLDALGQFFNMRSVNNQKAQSAYVQNQQWQQLLAALRGMQQPQWSWSPQSSFPAFNWQGPSSPFNLYTDAY